MKNAKQKGRFWLPASPHHKVDGDYDLIDEALGCLTLYDLIDTSVSTAIYWNEHFKRMQHPLIIGELRDSTFVALLQSSFRSISIDDTYVYDINVTLFTGTICLESEDELEFKTISFSFDHLHLYSGTCNIEEGLQFDPRSFSVKYATFTESFNLYDSLRCSFNYEFDSSFSSYLSTSTFTPVTFIEMESNTKMGILDWLRIIDKNIGSFLTILVGKYMCPIRVKVVFEFENKPYPIYVFCRVFRKHSDLSHNKKDYLKDLMPDLKNYLAAFYSFSIKYQLIVDNYLSLYKFDTVLEYKYLSAVYSIETYSRYVNQNHFFFSKEEFENTFHRPLIAYINSTISGDTNVDYVDRLKNAIKYSNELSLRALLKKLINETIDVFGEIFKDKVSDLAAKIVITRNWYTHFTKELEPSAAKGYDLYELYKKTRILFEILLFRQINMPDDVIIKTVKSTYLLD